MPRLAILVAGFSFVLSIFNPLRAETICSYDTFTWDTRLRKSVEHASVVKPYTELTEAEVDRASGCSICEQDQQVISLPPLPPFRVCRALAPRLERVLQRLLDRGAPIHRIVGYRVGKTSGAVDAAGRRTIFGNHSYGIAIDINPQQNGLYDKCVAFGPGCRLLRGGPWDPLQPESLTVDSPIVFELESIGLRWGGTIEGRQKDFMHFSPSGY